MTHENQNQQFPTITNEVAPNQVTDIPEDPELASPLMPTEATETAPAPDEAAAANQPETYPVAFTAAEAAGAAVRRIAQGGGSSADRLRAARRAAEQRSLQRMTQGMPTRFRRPATGERDEEA